MHPFSHRSPHAQQQQQQYQQQPNQAVAYNVVEALRNPYTLSQFHSPYSVHYMQSQQALHTTPEGYTLSSTYDPNARTHRYTPELHGQNSSFKNRGPIHRPPMNPPHPSARPSASWYQTGSSHCTYAGCRFTGLHKSVELHMMDRHLIYPPGWHKKQKKGSDWDADPSLKGKAIPIQGTSLLLNSEEALEVWLADRKKRWPTTERTKEKEVKTEMALAQGQLPFAGSSRGIKRRQEGTSRDFRTKKPRFGGNEPPRSKVHQASRMTGPKAQDRQATTVAAPQLDSKKGQSSPLPPAIGQVVDYPGSEGASDDDEAPESVSSKQPINPTVSPSAVPTGVEGTPSGALSLNIPRAGPKTFDKPKKKEPKLLPQNPFASRPALLRNLLLPEIRMTVSNLSQAIRFLVDNDFLQDVELEPGQANYNLIEVIDSQTAEPIDAPNQQSGSQTL